MSKKSLGKNDRREVTLTLPGKSTQTFNAFNAVVAGRQALHSQGYNVAMLYIQQIRQHLPNYAPTLLLEAECLHKKKEIEAAQQVLQSYQERSPNDPDAFLLQFKLYKEQRNMPEAFKALKKALQILPKEPAFHVAGGSAFRELGDHKKALSFYQRAIAVGPKHYGAYIQKTYIPGARLEEKEIKACQKMIDSNVHGNLVTSLLHFSLARHYDHAGEYQQAMMSLNMGNAIKRSDMGNPIAVAEHERFEEVTQAFSPEALEKLKLSDSVDDKLIFILGFPRSGSTLVEQIISAHSQVSSSGESNAIAMAQRAWVNTQHPAWFANSSLETLHKIKKSYDEVTEGFRNTPFLTDKSLENIYNVGLIKTLFPNAKIVHTFKDPIDCCFGCFRQVFESVSWPCIYDLETLREGYSNYHRLMQYWDEQFPGEIFHFRYESLIADQESYTKELLAYCSLPWEESCLNFYKSKNRVTTVSSLQVREKLSSKAVGRSEKYQEFLTALKPLRNLTPLVGKSEASNR